MGEAVMLRASFWERGSGSEGESRGASGAVGDRGGGCRGDVAGGIGARGIAGGRGFLGFGDGGSEGGEGVWRIGVEIGVEAGGAEGVCGADQGGVAADSSFAGRDGSLDGDGLCDFGEGDSGDLPAGGIVGGGVGDDRGARGVEEAVGGMGGGEADGDFGAHFRAPDWGIEEADRGVPVAVGEEAGVVAAGAA